MIKLIRLLLYIATPGFAAVWLMGCHTPANQVTLDIAARPFEKLSAYNFFRGTMNELLPNNRVLPYDLITPLFTDYAHKQRFVYVPEGKYAAYDTTRVLQLPVGACLIKNFFYPEDFRKPQGKRRIIETRVLVHREGGWDNLDYLWNEEQTEAFLDNTGDVTKVAWLDEQGHQRETNYVVPNKNQCKSCHWRNDASFSPIGPKVRNLNRDYTYEDGTENQLTRWVKAGILKSVPTAADIPQLPSWTDSAHYTVNERARAYLEMNCGHCHSPNGPAYTSGLYLNWESNNSEHLGFCKAPVAAGKATGNFLYDIVPGHPDQSIMMYRINSTDPGVKMPELGRTMVHDEGVALIKQWIAEMQPSDCNVR